MSKTSTYRFIEFARHGSSTTWVCRNRGNNGTLGVVEFYHPWRQYVFSAVEDAVFSADCLRDIAHFLQRKDKPT